MKEPLERVVREDTGQDLIEYALLAGFISLVAVAAITTVGTVVNTVYGNINTQVARIPGGGRVERNAHRTAPAAKQVDGVVDRDAVEPGADVGLSPKLADASVRLQECLLHDFSGSSSRPVSRYARRNSVRLWASTTAWNASASPLLARATKASSPMAIPGVRRGMSGFVRSVHAAAERLLVNAVDA